MSTLESLIQQSVIHCSRAHKDHWLAFCPIDGNRVAFIEPWTDSTTYRVAIYVVSEEASVNGFYTSDWSEAKTRFNSLCR